MNNKKNISLVIASAGSGTRMNSTVNKPYIHLFDKMILEMTLDTMVKIDEISEIILVIRKYDESNVKNLINKYHKPIKIVYGKETRQLSVFEGIKMVSKNSTHIMTHDAVRPFIKIKYIKKLIEESNKYKAVILGVNAKDTVKIIKDDFTVQSTPDRKYVYNIQTPQIFDKETLIRLYEKSLKENICVTDDSQLFEMFQIFDIPVKLIISDYSNIKITTREDLIFGKYLMENL